MKFISVASRRRWPGVAALIVMLKDSAQLGDFLKSEAHGAERNSHSTRTLRPGTSRSAGGALGHCIVWIFNRLEAASLRSPTCRITFPFSRDSFAGHIREYRIFPTWHGPN